MADRSDALPAAENQRKQNEVLAEMERALLAELDSTKFLQLLVESASRRFDALTGVWLVVGQLADAPAPAGHGRRRQPSRR